MGRRWEKLSRMMHVALEHFQQPLEAATSVLEKTKEIPSLWLESV
jgi:hypothetical protein